MKYFYISMAVMLTYLMVYCVACYHIYLKPRTESAGDTPRPIFRHKTYCAPAFLFTPTAKPGQY